MNDLQNKTVLLIEDEIITAKIISRQLLNENYNVCHIKSGSDSITMLNEKKFPIDIILMDIDLGDGIDGTMTAAEILKDNDIPIIFLSSHMEKEIMDKIEKIDSYGFISKSSGKDVLLLSIKMAFKLFYAKREIRKKYEELRISEEKFRLFFMNIADYGYMVLPDGTIAEVSNSICTILGYSREELIGKQIKIVYAEESKSKMKRLFMQWKETGEIRNEEMIIKTKSGCKRHVILNVNTIYDSQGEIINSISLQTDITERKIIEDRLKENQYLLNKAQEIAHLGHFKFDSTAEIIEGSDEFYNIFGMDREKFTVDDFINTIHPDDIRLVLYAVSSSPWDDAGFNIEFRLLLQDGSVRYVKLIGRNFQSPEKTAPVMMGTIQDITERWNYEKALCDTEKYYHILFDKALDGIIIMDSSGEFIDINESFAKMHGYTLEEMRKMKLTDIDTPETSKYQSERFQGVMNRETMIFEVDHFHKNGTIIHLSVTSMKIDLDGKPLFFGFHKDITESKRAEMALRESEEKYRRITESITDYMFTVKIIDGKHIDTTYGNSSLAVTGFTADEFKKDPYLWINMVHDDDKAIVRNQVLQITKTMKTSAIEHRIICKDGTIRWVSNTAVPELDANGALIGYNGLIQDITERKINEETLKQHQIKYRTVADFTYDWEYWKDPLGNYLYVSPSCERMTGYDPDIFMNDPFFINRIVHPDDRELLTRHFIHDNKEWDFSDFDFRIITRSGDTMWLSHRCQPVYDDSGKWLGMRGSHRDITKRKKAEEEIKKLNAHIINLQEEERQRIAKDLHDSVSQTLSAALLNIKSYMREPEKNQEQLIFGIQFLENASIEIREIYTGLYPSILKHMGLIATVKWYVRCHLDVNGIETVLSLPDEINIPHDREVHIYRILQEVISNIVKHAGATKVRIAMENTCPGIIIDIDDNGIGFSLEKKNSDRNGFGLLNIKQRMLNMQGTLSINSDANNGTRISMIIPGS